jgi:hypothetical protein
VLYSSPGPHKLEFTFQGRKRDYIRDDVLLHMPPHDLRIVHLPEEARRRQQNVDDLGLIAGALGADQTLIRNLTAEIDRNASQRFGRIHFEDEAWNEENGDESHPEFYTSLYVYTDKAGVLPLGALSGSEVHLILLEFAAALARERSRSAPTLLLLDGTGSNFSSQTWATVAARLLQQPFQTLAVIPTKDENDSIWKSWGEARLANDNGQTVIIQPD